jgi:hypothetical protein
MPFNAMAADKNQAAHHVVTPITTTTKAAIITDRHPFLGGGCHACHCAKWVLICQYPYDSLVAGGFMRKATRGVFFRLTEEQYHKLKVIAESYDMTVTEMVKFWAFGAKEGPKKKSLEAA